MANICKTKYYVIADKDGIEKLAKALEPCKKTRTTFLDVEENLGVNVDNPRYQRRRGEVLDYWYENDENIVIDTNTDWQEQEGFRYAITDACDAKVLFRDEEPGCGRYCTNDYDGIYFTENFVIDGMCDSLSRLLGYYDTFEDVVDALTDEDNHVLTKEQCTSVESVKKALEDMDETFEDEDEYLRLYQFENA